MCAHACVGACVVFVEFDDVLAGPWFIFGLDSAALVLSGYVLFFSCSFVQTSHMSRNKHRLTLPHTGSNRTA